MKTERETQCQSKRQRVTPAARGWLPAAGTGCLALLLWGSVHAQIVECVDAKGRKEFASQCPPGSTEARKLGRSGVGTASPAATKTYVEQDADFRKRQTERQEAETKAGKDRAESDERRKQCDQAQAQLKALETGQRIARFDPKSGERTILSDNDRPGETDQAKKSVQSLCK